MARRLAESRTSGNPDYLLMTAMDRHRPEWRRNFGAGDLLEVEQADGRKSLIPFKSGIADLQDGRIVLDPEFLA